MLTRVANDKFIYVPRAAPLREALMVDAIRFYEGLLVQAETDLMLRAEMAKILGLAGGVQRELGRYDESRQTLQRSISLFESLAAVVPNDPSYRTKLALTEQDLAYTLQITPPGPNDQQADAHYRRVLELFDGLERDWPKLRQPVAMCLHHLAELALNGGNQANAERLWKEAIERGEAYLTQEPNDFDARSQVCWACAMLATLPSTSSDKAEAILQNGLHHVATMLKANPDWDQAREVGATLNLFLATLYCRTGRVDRAIPLFQHAVQEIETQCWACPWTRPLWTNTRNIHEQTVSALQAAGRSEEAAKLAGKMYEWIQKTAPRVPDEREPQNELLETQKQLVKLLRSTGQDREADEISTAADDLQTKLDKRRRCGNA